MDDAQKRTLAAQINAIRSFVLKYQSNSRLVECNQEGFLRTFELDVAKTRENLARATKEHEQAVAKLASKRSETDHIIKWLEENKLRFESCECMLTDEAQKLAIELNKCLS